MVRHGSGIPEPGCITMQEAILLNQALNGGPSGPGTGFNPGGNQQQPPFLPQQPQQILNNFQQPPMPGIPGVNFLGGGSPERRGFENRFRSAGPVPIRQGTGWSQPGGFDGAMPTSINPGQRLPPGFINPTNGGAPFGNAGFGVDGGRNTRNSHAGNGNSFLDGQSRGFNTNTNQGNAFNGGRGSGFPGETQSPNVNPSNTEQVGQGDGRVSTIMQDNSGYYFIFYRASSPSGLRVNITKEGLCTRFEISPRDNQFCVTACSSDDECRENHKCCPTGCSLGCLPPFEETPGHQQQQNIPARVPDQPSVPDCFGPFAWCQAGSVCRLVQNNMFVGVYRCVPLQLRRMNQATTWIGRNTGVHGMMSNLNTPSLQRHLPVDPPNLVKKEQVVRTQIPGRETAQQRSWSNSNTNTSTRFPLVADFGRQDNIWNRSAPNNLSGNGNPADNCSPCTTNSDCNGLFSYCIPKVPCTGTVCHLVTQSE